MIYWFLDKCIGGNGNCGNVVIAKNHCPWNAETKADFAKCANPMDTFSEESNLNEKKSCLLANLG
jgi:hypothetical protein